MRWARLGRQKTKDLGGFEQTQAAASDQKEGGHKKVTRRRVDGLASGEEVSMWRQLKRS